MKKTLLAFSLLTISLVVLGANFLNTGVIVDNWTIDADGLVSTSSMSLQSAGAINQSALGSNNIVLGGNYSLVASGSQSQNISGNYLRLLGGTLTDSVGGNFYRAVSGSMSQAVTGNVDISGVKYTGAFTGLHYLSVGQYSLGSTNGALFSMDGSGNLQLFGNIANISMKGNGVITLRPDGNLAVVPGQNGDLVVQGQLSIGTSTSPRSSTVAEFSSTSAGLLLPRMTGAERDAISGPAAGLEIFNTSTAKKNIYNGSAWEEVTSTAASWFVDANITTDGGGNISLSLASPVSSYTHLTNSSLVLTNNTGSDSSVKIACDTTVTPSGTTCSSGNESLGISFVVPTTGTYRCCAEFLHHVNCPGTGSAVSAVFQLASSTSQTTTAQVSGRTRIGGQQNGGGVVQVNNPYNLCGNFTVASNPSDLQVVRIFYTQGIATASGNLTSNLIQLNSSPASGGDADMHWFCYKVL